MLSKNFVAHTRRVGDFIITFQWVEGEPAMCILRASMGRKSAFVVCLSAAWQYREPAYLIKQSMTAAKVLGMEMNKSAVHKIADTILDNLDALVRLAPEPEEAEIEREGKKPIVEFDQRTNTVKLIEPGLA